ncbi:MAG: TM2 domain-containing protein [Flavobacteriales bacterium]|nr:TM2 domain-containing protein [Flavobacteriales bacterium]
MRSAAALFLSLALGLLSLGAVASGPYAPLEVVRTATLDSLVAEGWMPDSGGTENARLVSSGLALLLGPFGAHRLYLGTTPKVAIIYGITFGGFGILALIDLGHLLFTKDLDAYRNSDRVFMWKTPPAPTPP